MGDHTPAPPAARRFLFDRRPGLLVAIAFGLAVADVVAAAVDRPDPDPVRPHLGPVSVSIIVAGAGMVLLIRALVLFVRGRRPARLVIDGGSFVAPTAPVMGYLTAGFVLLAGVQGAGVLDDWRGQAVSPYRPHLFAGVTTGSTAIAALLVVIAVVYVWAVISGRPQLRLTPHGLEHRDLARTRRITWEAIVRAALAPPAGRGRLVLLIRHPGSRVPPGVGQQVSITDSFLDVDPEFLADVIAHYAEQPAERPDIGAPSGYDRLVAALPAAEPLA